MKLLVTWGWGGEAVFLVPEDRETNVNSNSKTVTQKTNFINTQVIKSYRSKTIRIRWWLILLVWFDRVSSLLYFLQYFLLCPFYFFLCILIYMYIVKKTDNMHSWLLTICPWPHGNKTWTHDIWHYIFLVPMN